MLPIACDLNSQALDHNIDRLAREQISIQEKLNCIDAYLLVVSWRFRRFTQGHNVVHQKLLQSSMRQWTASWCILVAQQALNLHQCTSSGLFTSSALQVTVGGGYYLFWTTLTFSYENFINHHWRIWSRFWISALLNIYIMVLYPISTAESTLYPFSSQK